MEWRFEILVLCKLKKIMCCKYSRDTTDTIDVTIKTATKRGYSRKGSNKALVKYTQSTIPSWIYRYIMYLEVQKRVHFNLIQNTDFVNLNNKQKKVKTQDKQHHLAGLKRDEDMDSIYDSDDEAKLMSGAVSKSTISISTKNKKSKK